MTRLIITLMALLIVGCSAPSVRSDSSDDDDKQPKNRPAFHHMGILENKN